MSNYQALHSAWVLRQSEMCSTVRGNQDGRSTTQNAVPNRMHKVIPYLMRTVAIERDNQASSTYIPFARARIAGERKNSVDHTSSRTRVGHIDRCTHEVVAIPTKSGWLSTDRPFSSQELVGRAKSIRSPRIPLNHLFCHSCRHPEKPQLFSKSGLNGEFQPEGPPPRLEFRTADGTVRTNRD